LNTAGFKPAKINISSGFAIDMNSRYMSDLSTLVSAVDTIDVHDEDIQPLSIVKAICMNERPMLRSLSVFGDNSTQLQMCISLLLESSIVGLEVLRCSVPIDVSGRNCLVEFLSGQADMKELYLGTKSDDYKIPDGTSCMCNQHWVSCAGNLMMQPVFDCFQVQLDMSSNYTGVTRCAVIELLNLFLSAPASKPKKLTGYYFNVEVCECYAHEAITPCIVGDNSLEYKEATFYGNTDESLLDPILTCLSNFEIQLKYLSFGNYILKDVSLMSSFFSAPTFAIREVSLYYLEFPKLTSESDLHCLDGLLSKPTLKVFELTGFGGAELDSTEQELKVVTNALIKQASVGILESFIYDEFEPSFYDGIAADGVKEFVRVLLCLPQFLQFNLTFSYANELADMANEFWIGCANGRTLNPPPPNCRNSLLEAMLEAQGLGQC
jgi:hypothetical protein